MVKQEPQESIQTVNQTSASVNQQAAANQSHVAVNQQTSVNQLLLAAQQSQGTAQLLNAAAALSALQPQNATNVTTGTEVGSLVRDIFFNIYPFLNKSESKENAQVLMV